MLGELRSERFVDSLPAQVRATLLDEYPASERTFGRLLAARHGGVRERRDQLTHPPCAAPDTQQAGLVPARRPRRSEDAQQAQRPDRQPLQRGAVQALKYQPEFPDHFDSIEQPRVFCRGFFPWCNHEHRHSGIGLMAPTAVHHGQAKALPAARAGVL